MKNEEKTRKNAKITTNFAEKTQKSAKKMPKGVKFSKTNQPAKRGRKKKVATVLKELGREVSPEVEARIYEVMLDAISCRSDADAMKKLTEAEMAQPEYGWLYQRVLLAVKNDGLDAILEVLDRIFGKKSRVDLTTNGKSIAPVALVEFVHKEDNDAGKSKG